MSQLWIWTTLWMMMSMQQPDKSQHMEQATLGAGCFWCVEAVFQRVQGVVAVEAGYTGGDLENPTYQQVVSGRTGHAEVARVTFDPDEISFEEILEVFWHTHNPTTLNRQGADIGTQYRSAVFYHDDEQKRIAEESLERTDASDLWSDPIVTEITPLDKYYKAENYHQDYFNNNQNAGYCQVVIAPKLKKLRDDFPQLWQESVE
ncbi:MAG: peptide-methionine (S)-S-oxide reductase MsrA [Bacteroidota bacterium]